MTTISIEVVEAVPALPQPDEQELARLYEVHRAQINRFCMRELGSREDADDATQITFLNAFRGLSRGAAPKYESAWLFRIAHNVCLNSRRSAFRRRRVEVPSDLHELDSADHSNREHADDLVGLEEVLRSLPELQRRALLLREWRGLSYREIGAELELSQAAVETVIFRARRSVAQGLADPQGGRAAAVRPTAGSPRWS